MNRTSTLAALFILQLIACLSTESAVAQVAEPPAASLPRVALKDLDFSKAGFAPTLTADSDPICKTIATDARRYFQMSGQWDEYARGEMASEAGLEQIGLPQQDQPMIDLELQPLPGTVARHYSLNVPGSAPLFLNFHRNRGCGGACETESLIVSEQPEKAFDAIELHNPGVAITPAADSWTLYRSAGGAWYAAAIVDDNDLQIYALTRPERWRLTCQVRLKPTNLRESTEPALRAALQSIDAFNATVDSLIGDAGDFCGTMQTSSRLHDRLKDSLATALYRPWELLKGAFEYRKYQPTLEQLHIWSLTGWSEHTAFQHYNTQLAGTIEVLQRFYVSKFGWSADTAARMAYEALTTAVAGSMAFSSYHPFTSDAERPLREAILAQRPLAEIQAIELIPAARNAVLDIAVHYPEVLRYLLQSGADPNTSNAFGKTPLMYAAQYNSLAAVQLLLEAGADPTAATRLPDDHCYYTLTTTGTTALGYAVRYASAEVVELLRRHGP